MTKISLKAARVNARLTQTEAAEKIGVSIGTIKRWEAGKSFPNQPKIEKLCEAYEIEYDHIKFF